VKAFAGADVKSKMLTVIIIEGMSCKRQDFLNPAVVHFEGSQLYKASKSCWQCGQSSVALLGVLLSPISALHAVPDRIMWFLPGVQFTWHPT
jgi:hypothetical protein